METLNAIFAWFGEEIAAFGVRWLVIGVLAMLGALIFGRKYKQRIDSLEKDVDRLKAETKSSISQTFLFPPGQPLQDATSTATVQSLGKTMRQLPQIPLGDGHVYAELPEGTNIVSMASGEFRLALPIRLEAAESIGVTARLESKVTKTKSEMNS